MFFSNIPPASNSQLYCFTSWSLLAGSTVYINSSHINIITFRLSCHCKAPLRSVVLQEQDDIEANPDVSWCHWVQLELLGHNILRHPTVGQCSRRQESVHSGSAEFVWLLWHQQHHPAHPTLHRVSTTVTINPHYKDDFKYVETVPHKEGLLIPVELLWLIKPTVERINTLDFSRCGAMLFAKVGVFGNALYSSTLINYQLVI